MSKIIITIPIAIGVIAGAFLAFYGDEPRSLTLSKLLEGGSPVMGDPNAPVTILEWGDYQCTYCYRFHQSTLDVLNRDFVQTGKVNIVFKDFPLNGPDSILAAEASHCAGDQGRYWQYHDELYENWGGERTGWITRDALDRFAQNVGLDESIFGECMDEQRHRTKVAEMHEFGIQIGIDATPSFLIFDNTKIIKIRGNQPLDAFLMAFEGLKESSQN